MFPVKHNNTIRPAADAMLDREATARRSLGAQELLHC
jgi:hypothetical protein